jgi:hypothetical protein
MNTTTEKLEERRLQAKQITKLALVLEGAQSLGEWGDAADALRSQLTRIWVQWRRGVGVNNGLSRPISYHELLSRGQRLQDSQHYWCNPQAPKDSNWDWRSLNKVRPAEVMTNSWSLPGYDLFSGSGKLKLDLSEFIPCPRYREDHPPSFGGDRITRRQLTYILHPAFLKAE